MAGTKNICFLNNLTRKVQFFSMPFNVLFLVIYFNMITNIAYYSFRHVINWNYSYLGLCQRCVYLKKDMSPVSKSQQSATSSPLRSPRSNQQRRCQVLWIFENVSRMSGYFIFCDVELGRLLNCIQNIRSRLPIERSLMISSVKDVDEEII